jgi:hypothetical protein
MTYDLVIDKACASFALTQSIDLGYFVKYFILHYAWLNRLPDYVKSLTFERRFVFMNMFILVSR